MLNTLSKVFLFIYGLSLFVILFLPPNASNNFSLNFGLLILIVVGLFAFIPSVSIANNIKKLKISLSSRILSIILVDLLLYSTAMLFYGLGNIGVGEKGLAFGISLIIYLILLGLSLIIGIVLVLISKNQTIQKNPNKTLLIILIIVLALLFYSSTVSGLARVFQNPKLCSAHIEVKEDSFIFVKGMQDVCLFRVALDTSSVDYCNQIKDIYVDGLNTLKERCILNVARNLGDISICYQLNNNDPRQPWIDDCIRIVTGVENDESHK